ncbi:putative Late nodulin [Medicago truncatula]|uniref:Putative Late nodulin n=1 Tax=Medicago truncatula TaxID=3880 RepID=A0A396JFA4_MEDTR|nr:putative Late nodulin [Medicago truncatula]
MVVILKFVSTLILFLSFLSIATGARRIRRLNCNSDDGCPNNYCTPPHFGKCVSKQCVCMKLAWYTKP